MFSDHPSDSSCPEAMHIFAFGYLIVQYIEMGLVLCALAYACCFKERAQDQAAYFNEMHNDRQNFREIV